MTREMDLSPTEAGFCLQWHMVVYRSIVYQWLFSSVDVRETRIYYTELQKKCCKCEEHLERE
jgi:hypothetical protein